MENNWDLNEIEKKYESLKAQYEIPQITDVVDVGEKAGSFGKVDVVKKDEKLYAQKEIKIYNMSLEPNINTYGKSLYYVVREIYSLSKNDCLPLLKIRGFAIIKHKAYIYTDYIGNGSLKDHCLANDLTAPQCTVIACGIAFGLAKMHSIGFVHRDVKIENVMLDDNFEPVIIDFGTAKEMSDSNEDMHTVVGTPIYMAPEVCIRGYTTPYTKLVDVYSYGRVLLAMIKHKEPSFEEEVFSDSEAPEALINLIYDCFEEDCSNRPTFSQIYSLFKSDKIYFSEDSKKECLEALHKYIKKLENDSAEKVKTPYEAIKSLGNNKNSDIGSSLENIILNLDKSEMEELYPNIVNEIKTKSPLKGIFYKCLRILITKRSEFMDILSKEILLPKLDTENVEFCEDVFFLYVFYMHCNPNISVNILKKYFNNNKDKSRFKFVSFIFSLFLKNADRGHKNYAKFLKFYFEREVFSTFKNNGLLEEFLQGIAVLDKISREYFSDLKEYLSDLKEYFSVLKEYFFTDKELKDSYTPKEIHSLYKFLSVFNKKLNIKDFIPPECLKKHLKSNELKYDAINYIYITNQKVEPGMIQILKQTACVHTPSVLLLAKLVGESNELCAQVLENAEECKFNEIPCKYLFPIITEAINKYGFLLIKEFDVIPETLSRVVENYYSKHSGVIKEYLNKIKDLGDQLKDIYDALNKYNFWSNLFESIDKNDNDDCRIFLMVSDEICKNRDVDISPFIKVFNSFDLFDTVKQGLFLNFLKTCLENHKDMISAIKRTHIRDILNKESVPSARRIHHKIISEYFKD